MCLEIAIDFERYLFFSNILSVYKVLTSGYCSVMLLLLKSPPQKIVRKSSGYWLKIQDITFNEALKRVLSNL